MAPQRLEKIESAPGNGMGSETSDLQDMVSGRAADRALRLTKRWAAWESEREERRRGDPRRIAGLCFSALMTNNLSVKNKSCYVVCPYFSAPSARTCRAIRSRPLHAFVAADPSGRRTECLANRAAW
jgi:hypothetical protein